jgi:hypothetical protein
MPPAGLPAVAFGGTREPFEKGSLDSPKLFVAPSAGPYARMINAIIKNLRSETNTTRQPDRHPLPREAAPKSLGK